MVSALLYSISLRSGHYAKSPNEKFTVVPVFNFNREDFALRPEAVALFELVRDGPRNSSLTNCGNFNIFARIVSSAIL